MALPSCPPLPSRRPSCVAGESNPLLFTLPSFNHLLSLFVSGSLVSFLRVFFVSRVLLDLAATGQVPALLTSLHPTSARARRHACVSMCPHVLSLSMGACLVSHGASQTRPFLHAFLQSSFLLSSLRSLSNCRSVWRLPSSNAANAAFGWIRMRRATSRWRTRVSFLLFSLLRTTSLSFLNAKNKTDWWKKPKSLFCSVVTIRGTGGGGDARYLIPVLVVFASFSLPV